MKKLLVPLFAIISIILIYLGVHIVPISGALTSLTPKLVDQCNRLDIFPGTEDIAIDHQNNIAFVAAGERRSWYNNPHQTGPAQGGIYAFDINNPQTLQKISPPEFTDFLPHGISLWQGPNGERRLFVINHPSSGEEVVEIFSIANDHKLTHLRSVSFDAMHSPNDVVAVGPNQFYATNDRGFDGGIAGLLELYFVLPFSSIVYFDGENGQHVQKQMYYANGINQSPDGNTLYVAEFLKRRISVFTRNKTDGSLKRQQKIPLNTGPDNIDVDANGDLWVAGHSKGFAFQAHAKDAAKIAPSHVIKITPPNFNREDVFIDTKGIINGSSVGAAHIGESGGKLLVGAVFDGHIMICPL